MRKLLFLFIAVLAFSCSSDDGGNMTNPEVTNPEPADCVYTGNVTLKTQDEVNVFAAHGYCEIKGDLDLGGSETAPSNILNLSGLATLKRIEGRLIVHDNPDLVNMQGLHNISEVYFQLRIERNNALVNLNGLTSLSILNGPSYLLGSISIDGNKLLENLEGLGLIVKTGGIYIDDNPKLTSLEALNTIQEVKGGGIGVSSNALLINLKGLENITEITSLSVLNNGSLLTLEGLQNIYSVSDIFIQNNPSLTSITHLSGITTVTNSWLKTTSMIIDYNYALTSLDGLQNIININGRGQIQSNIQLKNLCAISNLVINGPYVSIAGNFYDPNKQAFIDGKCSVP